MTIQQAPFFHWQAEHIPLNQYIPTNTDLISKLALQVQRSDGNRQTIYFAKRLAAYLIDYAHREIMSSIN